MRILFVNPPYTNFEGIKESAGHMMPLSLGYLASYVRESIAGLDFKVLDAEALGLNYEGIRGEILGYAPDLVGITTPTPAVNHVYHICRITKRVDDGIQVVLGGIHPSVMPERTMKECSDIDFIIIGEGEETFAELVMTLKNNTRRYEDIKGICFREGGRIRRTQDRLPIRSLDSIPFPARDIYDLGLYWSAPTKKVSDGQATPILTSRGCPYNCSHCPSKNIWHQVVRYRSADNVVGEITECVSKYGLKEFNFFDDTFTLKKSKVIKICEKLIKKKLGISWICFARPDRLDEETIKYMKSAGCKKISLGLESGDQKILELMQKKTTIDMGKKAVDIIRRHGILVHATFMLGNVGETESSIKKTIDLARSLDLDNATFFITTPFPGTDLYEVAKELGTVSENTPWENFAPLTNARPILVQDNLTEHDLVYWQKKAFRKFYLRPAYILRKLKLHISKNGILMLWEGLRIFLRIMKKG